MIKLQQSQALTSHFESFWSIVHCVPKIIFSLLQLIDTVKIELMIAHSKMKMTVKEAVILPPNFKVTLTNM